jgi:outer membrane protein OmpA-like peptidoglycan-associated protein
MKKAFFPVLFLLFFVQSSQAQLRVALAGGGHSSNIKETNDQPGWDEIKNHYSGRGGVHFGFLADLQLSYKSRFYFQPGIMYYNKGRKFFNSYDTSVYDYFSIDAKQYINYIDVPLNILYKIPIGTKTKFFFGGGPYLSFFYNGKETKETYLKSGSYQTEENDDLPVGNNPGQYKTFDFGLNGTAGVEIGNFFISGNYSHGITDMYTAAYDGSFKNQVAGVTLGVFIGKPVELTGKIVDTDKDGIMDNEDDCVTEPGPMVTKGCPDTDGDGIADKADKCVTVPGLVKYEGCPVPDTDNDGINDENDKCPAVPGMAKYEGCPIPDSDGDSINDEEDKCPSLPGLARYKGCPVPDTDGDGLNDEEDKCITEPGTRENNGCPEIKQEVIKQVEFAAKKIQFEFGKAELTKESFEVLDEVADLLSNQPNLKLLIEGHTSSDGGFAANMKLSEERANSVKKYLVSKGVDESRLEAKGFGPTKPLNEGKTRDEKILNRRVEMTLKQ